MQRDGCEHQNLYTAWENRVRPMAAARRLTYRMIAQGCEVSETSARSFLKKIPVKRENVIMLAMMTRLTVEQTNELLAEGANYPKLCSAEPGDAIWIYLLEKGGSDEPRELYRAYSAAWEQYRGVCASQDVSDGDPEFLSWMKKCMPSFGKG